MIALAKQLKLKEDQQRLAGLAGLMHDLGKAAIPLKVLNKPGKLTDQEFTVVRSHPVEGFHMLKEGGNIPEAVLDACLHHHEKVDGSGYPDKLKGDGISVIARMTAICDVYDAITSDRPYKRGWDPAESLRRMADWTNDHFDAPAVPGVRQKHWHLPGGLAGAADFWSPGRGGRAGPCSAHHPGRQSVLFDQIRPAHSSRAGEPGRARRHRENRGAGRPRPMEFPRHERAVVGFSEQVW
jgi:HD-GYP domain